MSATCECGRIVGVEGSTRYPPTCPRHTVSRGDLSAEALRKLLDGRRGQLTQDERESWMATVARAVSLDAT